MIEIDGSMGYGQVLRTAIGLSALTLVPIKITNIRKNRENPGLMAQHLTGVQTAAEFTDAEVKGAKLHSTEVEFVPKKHNIKNRKIDIGTAGSIGLLLQTLTPLLLLSDKETALEIIGGTAGLGAPTIQFLQHVTFPVLEKMGITPPKIEILREGFYPKGQGKVKVTFNPNEKINSIKLLKREKIDSIEGISVSSKLLPEGIAKRQSLGAKKELAESGFMDAKIEEAICDTSSPGTSITLWADCGNTVIGSDVLGARGVAAEQVGRAASQELIRSLKSDSPFDIHMSDQIIPFIALAKGKSEIHVGELTEHCKSNMMVTEKILDAEFDVDTENRIIKT